ncbi:MAG: hypothetical protein BGO33_11235 [Bacteroidia bacterium 43-41]|nr:MAG: hypothetical protein BGO33_11235 [Bacteroidia bacterium 43-41]
MIFPKNNWIFHNSTPVNPLFSINGNKVQQKYLFFTIIKNKKGTFRHFFFKYLMGCFWDCEITGFGTNWVNRNGDIKR